jgi:hypothetical protein
MMPAIGIAPGHDAQQRSKDFDKAQRKARAKLVTISPNSADASLLLASPELLEACEALLRAIDQEPFSSALIEKAKAQATAAVAKAKAHVAHLPPDMIA